MSDPKIEQPLYLFHCSVDDTLTAVTIDETGGNLPQHYCNGGFWKPAGKIAIASQDRQWFTEMEDSIVANGFYVDYDDYDDLWDDPAWLEIVKYLRELKKK